MKNLIIKFDKSLIIPQQDFDIFKRENYRIDDGSSHLFINEANALLVLDSEDKPVLLVHFEQVLLENKQCFELDYIKYKLEKDIYLRDNLLDDKCIDVLKILKRVFLLLDNILLKREKKSIGTKDNKYNYLFYNKNKSMFDKLITLDKRISYLELLSKLEFLFTITD